VPKGRIRLRRDDRCYFERSLTASVLCAANCNRAHDIDGFAKILTSHGYHRIDLLIGNLASADQIFVALPPQQ
jgi:hypothetical protein